MDAQLVDKITKLRKRGKTYEEIQGSIKERVPKSTLSYWCSKIPKTKFYLKKMETLSHKNIIKAREAAILSNRTRQERVLLEIRERLGRFKSIKLSKDLLKIVLSILYLGEGSKWKSHRGLQLGSSDPEIVKLYIKLLERCYEIERDSLRCYICHRADQNLTKLKKFWSSELDIPLGHFYNSKPDARTVGKKTQNKNYMGVCVISCAGTKIQLELEFIPRLILSGL